MKSVFPPSEKTVGCIFFNLFFSHPPSTAVKTYQLNSSLEKTIIALNFRCKKRTAFFISVVFLIFFNRNFSYLNSLVENKMPATEIATEINFFLAFAVNIRNQVNSNKFLAFQSIYKNCVGLLCM